MICTVNYAEALVRPAEDERNLRAAIDAIASLGVRTSSPDAGVARLAARRRALGVSLADGFAIATAERLDAELASFDRRVRRALEGIEPQLSGAMTD